jgi:hypothetical protein
VLAGITNTAAFLGAQPPAGKTRKTTPKLISDCDYTVSGCGGDPTFGGAETSGGTNYDGVSGTDAEKPATCSSGTSFKCRVDTVRTCTQFVASSGSGSLTVNGGTTWGGTATATASGTCISYTVTATTYYWSKRTDG